MVTAGSPRTFESKEDEESNVVLFLPRVVDLAKEAKVIVALHRVVIVGHDVGVSVRDVVGSNDSAGFPGFPGQQEEGEDDAAGEDPFTDVEGNLNRFGVLSGFRSQDAARPLVGGQHGNSGVKIRNIDEKGFEDEDINPCIPFALR
jgi:hypothetical protein